MVCEHFLCHRVEIIARRGLTRDWDGLSAAGRAKLPQEWQKYTSPVASKSAAAICLGRMNGCFFSDFGEFSTLKA
jgi:hypothetical protein